MTSPLFSFRRLGSLLHTYVCTKRPVGTIVTVPPLILSEITYPFIYAVALYPCQKA